MVGTSSLYIKRKNFYLTYQHLERIYGNRDIALAATKCFFEDFEPHPNSVTIGVEDYPSEAGFHAHVLLEYLSPSSVKRELFNIENIVPFFQNVSHGQSSLRTVRDYCSKGDIVWTNYVPFNTDDASPWARAVAAATREEAESIIRTSFPDRFVLSYQNIQSFLNGHFSGRNTPYVLPETFSTPTVPDGAPGDLIQVWLDEEFIKVPELDPNLTFPFLFN